MRKKDFEFQYIDNCEVCGDTAFQPRSVLLLQRTKDLSQMYAQCSKCKSSFFVYLIRNRNKAVYVPILTDLSKSDVSRFQDMARITEAEVKALDATG